MYNVLIFSNDLKFIKKYSNLLAFNFNNIKLAGIASTKSELSAISQKQPIDLIILSYNDFYKKNIQIYLDDIKNKILICNKDFSIKKNTNYLCIPENLTPSSIVKILQNVLYKADEKITRQTIRKLMKSFEFDFKLKGSNYLLEAIVYSYMNKNSYLYDNLEKNIYSYLSKKYEVTTSVIKHSIIRSLNNANSNRLKSCFKNLDKITSKTFITEMVNRI